MSEFDYVIGFINYKIKGWREKEQGDLYSYKN